MARCFPFPPSGYVKIEILDDELLNGSIKVEIKAAKKQRTEEKKQEKNEKRRTKEIGDVESKKHKHKRRREEERSQKDKVGSGCFEKSSLTEEWGHPAGSQNSTDNTLKSSKRQKLNSPPIIRRSSSGRIIRIKMPRQRQMGPEVLPIKEQQHSSPLGRTDDDAWVRAMHETALIPGSEPCSTSGNTGSELTIRLSKSKPSPSAIVSQIPNLKDFAEPPSSLCASCPPTFTSDFRDMIADLIRPTLEDTDLQSWLFETKNDQNRKSINNKGSTGVNSAATGLTSEKSADVGCYSSGITAVDYPRAQCLHEAGIYALPYALPY